MRNAAGGSPARRRQRPIPARPRTNSARARAGPPLDRAAVRLLLRRPSLAPQPRDRDRRARGRPRRDPPDRQAARASGARRRGGIAGARADSSPDGAIGAGAFDVSGGAWVRRPGRRLVARLGAGRSRRRDGAVARPRPRASAGAGGGASGPRRGATRTGRRGRRREWRGAARRAQATAGAGGEARADRERRPTSPRRLRPVAGVARRASRSCRADLGGLRVGASAGSWTAGGVRAPRCRLAGGERVAEAWAPVRSPAAGRRPVGASAPAGGDAGCS